MNLYVDPEVQAQLRRMLHDINARRPPVRNNGRRQLAPHERDPELDRRMGVNLSASPAMRRGLMTPTEARAALASGPLSEGEHLVDRAMRMERHDAPAPARGDNVRVDPLTGAVRMSHVPFGRATTRDAMRDGFRRMNDARGGRMSDQVQPLRAADIAREGFARINAARGAAR